MCLNEGHSLQRGMNFRIGQSGSIILMSVRRGAPYADRIEDGGKTLIYEGHDLPINLSHSPKTEDQSLTLPSGLLTQNGKFFEAALAFKNSKKIPELVRVYEKIKDGIWVYNGIFELIDAWQEKSNNRNVFKFKLRIIDKTVSARKKQAKQLKELLHNRIIPTSVKIEVWKRDSGKCVQCGATDNLHFDHILPYSKGGTSLKAKNIQLLCARHNLEKHDKIM